MGNCLCANNASVQPESQQTPTNQSSGHAESATQYITPSNKRSCTDVFSLLLFASFLIVLVGLIIYCMSYGDIYRIVNGYDDCANVCGKQNKDTLLYPQNSCKREDMTKKRFLVISSAGESTVNLNKIHRECVEMCDENVYEEFGNRCVPKQTERVVNKFFSKTGLTNFFQEASEDLDLCWKEIAYLCALAFVLSVIILILFRFVVGFIIWTVLIGVSIASIVATLFLWITWKSEKDNLEKYSEQNQAEVNKRRVKSYLAYAIIATLATVVILLVLLVMRKRIALVVELFKEAGKAISSMPFILFEPIVTFSALVLTIFLWIYLSIWIESSGTLSSETNQSLHYKKDVTMKVSRWYNLFALFWITQFIIGCQHMIIGGAVATWFFTRNKKNLDTPLIDSAKTLVRYHLGTVALGSFLIAFLQFLKSILFYCNQQLKGSSNKAVQCVYRSCQCCLTLFENFLRYLSRNAYVETSIYGVGFCTAGKKAFKVLSSNALRVFAINSVGDFILFLGKAFVVIVTVLIGIEFIQKKEGVQHVWVPLTIVGLVAYITSHCFMTVYEMTIDTIFICFCEDCEKNDGLSRPYFMSRGLMQFVQNSKKALAIYDESELPNQAWSKPASVSETIDR